MILVLHNSRTLHAQINVQKFDVKLLVRMLIEFYRLKLPLSAMCSTFFPGSISVLFTHGPTMISRSHKKSYYRIVSQELLVDSWVSKERISRSPNIAALARQYHQVSPVKGNSGKAFMHGVLDVYFPPSKRQYHLICTCTE